jgi:hypothetical protein
VIGVPSQPSLEIYEQIRQAGMGMELGTKCLKLMDQTAITTELLTSKSRHYEKCWGSVGTLAG